VAGLSRGGRNYPVLPIPSRAGRGPVAVPVYRNRSPSPQRIPEGGLAFRRRAVPVGVLQDKCPPAAAAGAASHNRFFALAVGDGAFIGARCRSGLSLTVAVCRAESYGDRVGKLDPVDGNRISDARTLGCNRWRYAESTWVEYVFALASTPQPAFAQHDSGTSPNQPLESAAPSERREIGLAK